MDSHELVEAIYQAAVEPDLWSVVLQDIARSVDAAYGILLTRRNDAWIGWRHSTGAPAAFDDYLRSPAATKTETTARLIAANRAGFIANHEVFTDDEWLADPMMSEAGRQANLMHAAATAIHLPTGDMAIVQVMRRRGLPAFTAGDVKQLDVFRPHLARAALLSARWRLEKLRAATEALAMIGLQAAAIDRAGRVLAANSLIQAESKWVTWLPGDRLAVVDPSADGMLKAALAELHDPASNRTRSIPIRPRGTQEAAVAHVIPTTNAARELFAGATGLLVITPIAKGTEVNAMPILQALFDLTPAEARVASRIAQGLSLRQIAAQHVVSIETVRIQTKAVFAKTGTNRQAQVAALLAGVPGYISESKPRAKPRR
jgi:DNA-binding CsgD family transcriptional regulator